MGLTVYIATRLNTIEARTVPDPTPSGAIMERVVCVYIYEQEPVRVAENCKVHSLGSPIQTHTWGL